jgi:hypothetical protein
LNRERELPLRSKRLGHGIGDARASKRRCESRKAREHHAREKRAERKRNRRNADLREVTFDYSYHCIANSVGLLAELLGDAFAKGGCEPTAAVFRPYMVFVGP